MHPIYEARPEGTDEKWNRCRVNRKFILSLWQVFGSEPFTNKHAYRVYMRHHASERARTSERPEVRLWGTPFNQTNVRNWVSTLAHRSKGELLKRIRPGVYQFTQNPLWYEKGIVAALPHDDPRVAPNYRPGDYWFLLENGDILQVTPPDPRNNQACVEYEILVDSHRLTFLPYTTPTTPTTAGEA